MNCINTVYRYELCMDTVYGYKLYKLDMNCVWIVFDMNCDIICVWIEYNEYSV